MRQAWFLQDGLVTADATRVSRSLAPHQPLGSVTGLAAVTSEDGRLARDSFWQATLDALDARVAVLDEHGVILVTNASWDRFAAENEPVDEAAAQGIRAVVSGARERFDLEYPCHLPDRERWFALRAVRQRIPGPVRVVVQREDISALRRAEEEALVRANLIDVVDAAVIATDRSSRVTQWNAGAERSFGWTAAEAVGRPITDLAVKPADLEEAAAIRTNLHSTGRWEGRFDALRKDGSSFPSLVRNVVTFGADGELAGVVGVCFDLTASVEAERELRSARDFSRAVTDSMGEGVCALDLDGLLVYMNPTAERMLGWTLDEVAGQSMHELIHRHGPDGGIGSDDDCALLQALQSGEVVRNEDDRFTRRDGTTLAVAYGAAPSETPDGIRGSVYVFSDMTERKARAAQQEAVSMLGSVALRGMPTDELMQEAARIVEKTLGADAAGVLPYTAAGGLELRGASGETDLRPPDAARSSGPAEIMDFMRHADGPLLVADLGVSALRAPILEAEGMVSLVVAPIGSVDDRYGLLGACSRRAGAFAQDDLGFLQAMANILAEAAERERAADEAQHREAQLNEAQRLAGVGSWEIDLRTGQHAVSDHLRDMLGLDEMMTDAEAIFACVHAEDRPALRRHMADSVAQARVEPYEFRIVAPGGAVRLLQGRGTGERGTDGRTVALRGTVQDVTDQRHAEEALRCSEERFRKGFDLSPVGMTLVSPASGRYLRVNASYCRFVGRSAEELLSLTGADVVHPDDLKAVARAEFGEGRTSELVIEGRYVRPDGSIVWGSIHSARVLGADGSVDVIFSQVQDVTERLAKEEATRRELDTVAWVREIHAALAEDRFELHAQPIVDLATDEVVQHELLLRMRSATGELVAPGEFLPAAERYGVIRDIDHWVISRGTELAAQGMSVEINISGMSIGDASLIDEIDRALERTGADPSRLVFEITETALIENVDTARRLAQGLRERGCRFALDDFGTGFAGLSSLKTLPLDYLKIDREFVRDLCVSETDRHVITATIDLARAFGLKTIAEGVETRETLDLLRKLGVDHAQGYFLGRPAPIESGAANSSN